MEVKLANSGPDSHSCDTIKVHLFGSLFRLGNKDKTVS